MMMPGRVASAPGKVMLAGEYAVLCGAPALVQAVDRRVSVCIERSTSWRADSDLFAGDGFEVADRQGIPDTPLGRLLRLTVGERAGPFAMATRSGRLRDGEVKLGLGSSAAVSVAAAHAMSCLAGEPVPALPELIAFHDAVQGKAGSGADVAASRAGGLVRFERTAAGPSSRRLPPLRLPMRFLWSGKPARTADFIAGFDRYRCQPGAAALIDELCQCARRIAGLGSPPQALCEALADYARLTECLGREAGLPIHGAGHARLGALAREYGVVYKPCGAGGGDMGLAASDDEERLAAFCRAAQSAGTHLVDLAPAHAGVEVDAVGNG